MKGLQLSSLTGQLHRVEVQYNDRPVQSIENIDAKLGRWREHWIENYRNDFSFLDHYHELPLKAFRGFSFDELCKLKYSSSIMMDESVRKLFETDARHEFVRKIMSSMWRWGFGKGTWNEVVDAHERIRNFSFVNDPDFQIRLDHTTHFNERGYAKYSRTFLDGIFAFLIYFKGEHVMTVGFSVMEKRRLLLQQVQSAKRTGNRYLYRLPSNRLEFVVEVLSANFPEYQIHVVDGKSLVKKTLADYHNALNAANKYRKRQRAYSKNSVGEARSNHERILRQSAQECRELSQKILHLRSDMPRLVDFYGNTGRFALGPAKRVVNGLTHYVVVG